MPLLRSSRDYATVYRPRGAPYAEGRGASAGGALQRAYDAFASEFGHPPDPSFVVAEIVGSSVGFVATVIELPEDDE